MNARAAAAICAYLAAGLAVDTQLALHGQLVLGAVGCKGIPVAGVGNFCASGSTAFREAVIAVLSAPRIARARFSAGVSAGTRKAKSRVIACSAGGE